MGYSKNEGMGCSGYRKTWPWKGYPCGASATHYKDGKWWCKNHLPEDCERPKEGDIKPTEKHNGR